MISQNRLKELLEYDPDTGIFKWKVHRYRYKAGDIAGHVIGPGKKNEGYVKIKVDHIQYSAHRLAFLYMTGSFPKEQCDHINGIRNDNRWTNLRECNYYENGQNKNKYKSNKSGYMGVSLDKSTRKWVSQIRHKGKVYYLGSFDDPKEAHIKYLEHKKNLHKFNPTPRENGA